MPVGETIREVRKAQGITQKQLSKLSGIDDSTIRKYESGRLNPKYETLAKLAGCLDVEVDVLVESKVDTVKAMLKLFSVYKAYPGNILDGEQLKEKVINGEIDEEEIYVSFSSLSVFMRSWKQQYDEYQKELVAAEQIVDEGKRNVAVEKAEEKFSLWMSKYPKSEPQKVMLKFSMAMGEAGDYMGSHPLNDPENPVTEKEKKKHIKKLKKIQSKMSKIDLRDRNYYEVKEINEVLKESEKVDNSDENLF